MKKMHKNNRWSLGRAIGTLLCGLCLLCACGRKETYLHFVPTDIAGWDKTEKLDFRVDSLPESADYVPDLLVRKVVAGDYPYQSLTLEVRQRWVLPEVQQRRKPKSNKRTYLVPLPQERPRVQRSRRSRLLLERTDTVVCRFMTAGGDLMAGGVSLAQYTFTLPPLTLPRGAEGRIVVRHLMLKEVIPGISDVGVSLTPSWVRH